jgi:predicted lipid-binding transport protein (Tim44 family)
MGDGFAYLDVVLLALVAGFLILRLRSVLGRRTGTEKRPSDPFQARDATEPRRGPQTPLPLPDLTVPPRGTVHEAEAGGALGLGLKQIAAADPSFAPASFLEGARKSFSWVVESFAKGDSKTLRPLLNDEVYGNFAAAIETRAKAGETLETTLVSVKSADILEARLDGKLAVVTVKFVSEQVNVTRNRAGEVIDGDPVRVVAITDIWTFARDARSRDPNWVLVATRSSN